MGSKNRWLAVVGLVVMTVLASAMLSGTAGAGVQCLTVREATSTSTRCPAGSPTIVGYSRFGTATVTAPGVASVTASGDVYRYDYGLVASLGGLQLAAPIVGIAVHPLTWDIPSYWLAASDGGVFSLDGAPFFGSMGGRPLNAPVVGIASTEDGGGYYLVAADGGVFAFGDAHFYGSMGGKLLNAPVVGMDVEGNGYYLVAADGGVFAFGTVPFLGSMGGQHLDTPVVGMATKGGGYYLAAADGGIFTFGTGLPSFSFKGEPYGPVIAVTIEIVFPVTTPSLSGPAIVTSQGDFVVTVGAFIITEP